MEKDRIIMLSPKVKKDLMLLLFNILKNCEVMQTLAQF
jgi:hypothetical protein